METTLTKLGYEKKIPLSVCVSVCVSVYVHLFTIFNLGIFFSLNLCQSKIV